MILSSPVFENGGNIPAKYTCDGENVSPPLVIEDVPAGTKSLVLIVDDPDATRLRQGYGGQAWVHWTMWNIKPEVGEIAEKGVPEGVAQGVTSFEEIGYGGCCPPSGVEAHRYFFRLYAIDMELDLPATTTASQLEAALVGHIVDQTEMMGRYART